MLNEIDRGEIRANLLAGSTEFYAQRLSHSEPCRNELNLRIRSVTFGIRER